MAKRINFEAKTDRELLILTASAVNDISKELKILNGTVAKHEARLTILETKEKSNSSPKALNRIVGIGKGYPGAILIIAALISAVYYAGCALGWWGG